MIYEETIGGFFVKHAVDESPKDECFPMQVHEDCEIYFFVSGNAEYLVEGTHYPLQPGSLLMIKPAESHKVRILGPERYERYAFNFPYSSLDAIDSERRLMQTFINKPLGRDCLLTYEDLGTDFTDIFQKLTLESGDRYEHRLRCTMILIRLLDLIDRALKNKTPEPEKKPRSMPEQILSYINENLVSLNGVSELAEHFYLSTSQLNRLFRRMTGAAPWEYITAKRLTLARERIRLGASAQSACEACGFGDYSAFYRAYVKYFGSTPKEDSVRLSEKTDHS